jgi:hypothetical protein
LIDKCLINKGPPNNIDWKNTRIFIKFLRLFHGVTLRFSGFLHVMSNYFFHELVSIQTQISKLSKNKDFLTNEMTSNMKCKFDEYWRKFEDINSFLFVVINLDPHYKLKYMKSCLS